ncbi:MAG: Abortive infection protein [Gemmatimonadetes bacterium]|nr:Abortive infection protein [Gemmatimonadota bacterium]
MLLFIVLQVSMFSVLGSLIPARVTSRTQLLEVDSLLQLVAALGATAIMLRSIDIRPWDDVALARRAARPRSILEGWCLGGAAIGFACGLLLAFGWLRIVPGPPGSSLATAASLTLMLVIAALAEEVIARGYLLTVLRDGLGDWGAIATTSLLFGAAHLLNAGVTAESFAIVTLAGVFLAAVRVVFRSVYASWAAHVAWNWVMAVLFHASVSGIAFDAPDYRMVSTGPEWITGGAWGPEGGIAAALGMLAALAYLYRTRRRREEP